MEEGGILLVEAISEVIVLKAVEGTLGVPEDMAGVNSEAKGSFQGDRKVPVDAMEERVISGLIRMEMEGEEDVKVV